MALTSLQYSQLSFGYLRGEDLLKWAPAQLLIKQNTQDANNPQDACNTAYNEIMAELGTRYDFTFEMAKAGPTNAVATALIVANQVNSITINNPGSGYILPPVVNFIGGGGTGAQATALLDENGAVIGFNITNPGSGYTSAPTITFTGVPFVAGSLAAVVINGTISSITINSGGSGYMEAPVIRITGGGGRNASAIAQIANGAISGVNLLDGGWGYTSTPNVLVFGGMAVDNRDPLLVKILSLLAVRNALGSFENISEKMTDDFKWCDKKILSIRNGQSNLALNAQASCISHGPGSEAEMVPSTFWTLG